MITHSFIAKAMEEAVARKLDEEKRSRILRAARDAFGAEGFQKTTIKRIAEATGLAQGTIYTYFTSKEILFDEAVEEIWRNFDRGMKKITFESTSIAEKAARFLEFSFDLLLRIHPLLRGMFSEAVRRNLLKNKLEAICRYIEDLFTSPDGEPILYRGRSAETRKFNINVMVSGILFRISLTKSEDLSAEIYELKNALLKTMAENAIPGIVS